MNAPHLGGLVDERFLTHRLRSTSLAGIVGAVTAGALFAYRYYVGHLWSWDLFAVITVMAIAKVALLIWYRVTD